VDGKYGCPSPEHQDKELKGNTLRPEVRSKEGFAQTDGYREGCSHAQAHEAYPAWMPIRHE